MSSSVSGRLVLVGTPIGNLGDISPRALEALGQAAVVACEDTRRTGRLLSHFGIASPTYIVVNEHTEGEAAERLLGHVQRGDVVVLVSDAGMPGVSDPGEFLVSKAIEAGVTVEVVPGPSAVLHALVASGLTTSRFVFEGFLPRKGSGRALRLRELADEHRTAVLFEAPHRLAKTLNDLAEVCGGQRRIVLARELTKLHEEIWRGSLAEALTRCGEVDPRGEYVLVLDGAAPRADATDDELRQAARESLAKGASKRDAAAAVADVFAVSRKRVYDLVITLQA
ncbi:MAG: 16S rRNA (cytidine(1402)-2'-O)-methyltransferase [Acidimicrobiia bacterium]|nr:16S rRNA (cytidine(1402)-2'-O)-methyltransferase [Acidimicrobiia bacterium]